MKSAELKSLSKDELLEKLEEVSLKLNLFYTLPKEKIEKPREKSQLRHDRARILTFINQIKS